MGAQMGSVSSGRLGKNYVRSPENEIRGRRTRRTASRVATHQVHGLLGLMDEPLAEARANMAELQNHPG